MANGQGRSFFRAQTLETGWHRAYEQMLEEEYVFSIDRGAKPPFETCNDATRELQGIIQTCVQNGKSLRAHGSLWSLSTVAVTDGWLIDTTAIMELGAVNTPETRTFYNRVCNDLDVVGIPFTLHWGTYNSFLTPDHVRNRYGDTAVDQWIASRDILMENAAVRQIFKNVFTAGLGLAS